MGEIIDVQHLNLDPGIKDGTTVMKLLDDLYDKIKEYQMILKILDKDEKYKGYYSR